MVLSTSLSTQSSPQHDHHSPPCCRTHRAFDPSSRCPCSSAVGSCGLSFDDRLPPPSPPHLHPVFIARHHNDSSRSPCSSSLPQRHCPSLFVDHSGHFPQP